MRAIVTGPPAYMRRLRAIEDLEQAIVDTLARSGRRAAQSGLDREEQMRACPPARLLEQLTILVMQHNRFYPIEANLPFDMKTGRLLERGKPWTRMAVFTFEALVEEARSR